MSKKMYGMEQPNRSNKHLCSKCNAYFEIRGSSPKQKCPWCGTEVFNKGQKPTTDKKEPTDTDFALFNILKTATEAQKQQLLRFAEDEL